jgi:hypothetical protein
MIKDSFWTDSYIANLDPTEKLLYIYLLTNPLCNIAGIYEIQGRRIAFDTGIDRDMVEKLLGRFESEGKILRCDDWIVIINYAKHQSYKNPNVTKGISRIIEELPLKVKALKGFERLSHLTLLNLTLPNLTEAQSAERNMPFNKHADDYEEGVIDADGDGSLKAIKKVPTKKYPNAPTIRKIFQEILGLNPSNWRINKTQLQACENLYTERTPEKVRSALEFFKEHKHDEFCPQITSPYDLDSKWTKLGEYKLKL